MTTRILLASLLASLLPAAASAETIIALRDGDAPDLVSFDSANPARLNGRLAISGLPTLPVRARAVAVEFRPAGGLYLLVKGLPADTDCGVYTVNTASGQAFPVANVTVPCGTLGEPDIDPKNDQMRVLGGTGNYRLTLATGFPATVSKFAGTALAFKVGDANAAATPNVVAAAYDQNVSSAANTTLFAIDAGTASLVRVGDVNGTVTAQDSGALTTIGALGVALAGAAFDVSGSSATGFLYVWQQAATPNANGFYSVNMSTGAATLVGTVGDGSRRIIGLTAVPGTIFLPEPEVAATVDDGGALPLPGIALLAGLGWWRRRRAR